MERESNPKVSRDLGHEASHFGRGGGLRGTRCTSLTLTLSQGEGRSMAPG